MEELPIALEPLEELRETLLTSIRLLETEQDGTVRADLASETVGIAARYEDVKERVVYPALRRVSAPQEMLDQAEMQQGKVRTSLEEVRRRTRHVKPNDVFADDPEGTEQAIETMVADLRRHLSDEDAGILPVLARLDPESSRRLRSDVGKALATASTHPAPPHSRIGRVMVALHEKLERDVKDESTPVHPGVTKLHEELARTHVRSQNRR
jgi:hypothetical protein